VTGAAQVVAASHSEGAAERGRQTRRAVAFVASRIGSVRRRSQVAKALNLLGFEQYYLAETKGLVLYLEGSTDLAILQAFARTPRPSRGGRKCWSSPSSSTSATSCSTRASISTASARRSRTLSA